MQYEGLDEAMVRGLRDGNDRAAQQLIDTYSTSLYHYLRRRCFCDEDAVDILSMVFQKVVAAVHSYDGARGSFKNWLYHVAQTCRADFYRGWGGVCASELPSDDLLESSDEDGAFGEPWRYLIEDGVEEAPSPLTRAVQDVYGRMPSRYVEVLQLAHTDLTREEIAHLLGVSREHLRVLINRASNRFKQLAEEHPLLADWLARAEPLVEEEEGRRGPALVAN